MELFALLFCLVFISMVGFVASAVHSVTPRPYAKLRFFVAATAAKPVTVLPHRLERMLEAA